MGIAKLTGLLIKRRQVEVAHETGLSGQMIELSEEEWLAQLGLKNLSTN
ncbi:hypothetical protein SAZ10_21600 [Mesorhizobium sp. BAC0120]|nr:hypothetical protein [Mesorhizobium sp. BAC0120]MDW6024350.1 hypothetical protein [Mesorhizobium sp. BAC0120]